MKKILLLLVLFFGSNNIIKSQHPDGTILPREISRFENGNSSWESEMVIIKNKKYNIGWYRKWYENGQLCFEKYYHNPGCINNPKFKDQPALNGISKICRKPFPDKTWESFYKNGARSSITKYKSKYTDEGVYYTQLSEKIGWFENGQKYTQEEYRDSDSIWYKKYWYEDGKIKSEIIYQRAFKKSSYSSRNKYKWEKGRNLNSPIIKYRKDWYSNGQLMKETQYFNYPKIDVQINSTCSLDEPVKSSTEWNKEGKIITKKQYILLEDNTINRQGNYEQIVRGCGISKNMIAKRHGDFIYNTYYSDGSLTRKIIRYDKGTEISKDEFTLNQFLDTISNNDNDITYLYDSHDVNVLRIEDSLINLIDVYSTGEIKSKIDYLDGKRDIVVTYLNGDRKLEYSDFNNELNGSFNAYYANGNLYCRLSYVDGSLDGDCSFFYNNNQIKADLRFDQGKLDGEQRYYYENGIIQDLHKYKNGKLDGSQKSYFINGNIRLDVFVEESTSKNRNKIIKLNKNMKLSENEEIYYSLTEHTDIDVSYYYDSVYINTDSLVFQNGSKTSYYKSGQRKSTEYFRNSKREGKQSYYDSSGDILSKEWYSNGKRLDDYISVDIAFELPRFYWKKHVQNNVQTNIAESYEYYKFDTKINEYSLAKNIIDIFQKLSYNNEECKYNISKNSLDLNVKINLPREKEGKEYNLSDFHRDFMSLIEESNISSKFNIYFTLNGEVYSVSIDDTPLISIEELDLRSNLSHCECILAYDLLLYKYINFVDENMNILLTEDESRNPIKGISKDKKKEYKSLKSLYSKIRKRCKKTNVYIISSDNLNHILFYIDDDLNQYLNCERFIPLERRLIRYNHISSHYIDLFY